MNKSAILFSKEHVKSIEFKHRLPPTSIGVRRLRPSSKEVMKELKRQKRAKGGEHKQNQENSSVNGVSVNIIDGNGGVDVNEPAGDPFTTKENTTKGAPVAHPADREIQVEEAVTADTSEQSATEASDVPFITTTKQYFQLKVNNQLIQQEIDEIRGADRSAYNNLPALLTPSMTAQACHHGLIPKNLCQSGGVSQSMQDTGSPSNTGMFRRNIRLDDTLARRWAEALQLSMKNAEHDRGKEDMRPMAYRLIPEVWSRLRPIPSAMSTADKARLDEGQHPTKSSHDDASKVKECKPNNNCMEDDSNGRDGDGQGIEVIFINSIHQHSGYSHASSCSITSTIQYDLAHDIIYEYMYNNFSNIHVSCGAKFGCDYLLYDGNRKERHAFAGLRIFSAIDSDTNVLNELHKTREHAITIKDEDAHGNKDGSSDRPIYFPLPTAYDLHGYVRSMNTAGKLALLAIMMESNLEGGEDCNVEYHVAFVDLALEKILNAPSHLKKRKRVVEARKQIGQNLAKA